MHSLKDLPTAPAPGIALAAVPAREDPRDVVVARDGLTLGELPGRQPGRHRLAAPGRPAARARPRPRDRRHPRQRRHPDRQGPVGGVRRRRAGPRRAGPARPARRGRPRCSTRCRCCPPPARERWPSSAAPTTTCWPSSPRSTTRAPGPRSTPSGPCWPPSRPAAPPRSAPWPRSPRATTATSSGSGPSPCRPTGRSPCGCRPPGPPPTPPTSGSAARDARCSPTEQTSREPDATSTSRPARRQQRMTRGKTSTHHSDRQTQHSHPRAGCRFVGRAPATPAC